MPASYLRALPVFAALAIASASQAAPLETYGRLPSLEEVSLSPDGARVAFVRDLGSERVIVLFALADRAVQGLLRIKEQKVRSLDWADDSRLLIETSQTSLPEGFIGAESEWSLLRVYDIGKKTSTLVPDGARLREQSLMNVIAGPVMVRRVNGHTILFFPGIYAESHTMLALLKVDLDDGREKVIRYGTDDSREWLVDDEGSVIAEQSYSEKKRHWSLSIPQDGKMHEVAGGEASITYPRLIGFGPTADTLLMEVGGEGDTEWKLLSLKDGSLGPSLANGKPMESPIEDRLTHRTIGGSYWDDYERYVFFDPAMQAHWDAIVGAFAGDHVTFISASGDLKKIVVLVDGPKFGYQYQLVDLVTHKADLVGDVYEGIAEPLEVRRIDYRAADGLQIPAYLTLPRGRAARSLPLIVLPHGGPEARDEAQFDWQAQALADQGYAVLQPNFRGSALSSSFVAAGYGEFGRKMQTDLSDGVRYLVKEGIADPARVCIVGASYGGYAALAGVTLDPGVYRCAVSVAGISDLRGFLKWVNQTHLSDTSIGQRYWDRFLGVKGLDDPVLERISPIKHVKAVTVPVLLIHGKDDTVVPYDQSDDMVDALKDAGKTVEFVKLKHEDHWLSRSETRLQMLQATVAFLRKYNPPD